MLALCASVLVAACEAAVWHQVATVFSQPQAASLTIPSIARAQCVLSLSMHAAVSCPSVAGYSTTVGQDHNGDDIGCYGGTDFNTAASACNSNPSCKAFNVLPNNGFYCIKVASSPLASASNVCFYTKNTATGEAWAD